MDNAVAHPIQTAPLPAATDFGARLQAMPARAKASFAIGVLALVGVVLSLTMWSSQGDYKVLYANLSDKDGGAIIAQLSQLNVPYRHADGGAAILVPASQVHDLRLKLAAAGLPRGSVVGYEITDTARFGLTQFGERLNYQRALEGELTRSITALAAVQAARVHLALPNQNGFFREQQKPSASVLLTLHAGRTLDRAQVAGIVHLVASSVADLNPKAVSVLDQTGTLLSGVSDSGTANAGLDAQQLQYVSQVEQGYAKRIVELLEPVVGRDNLRASVTAEIDFSQTESTSELFKPNQGEMAQRAVRSQQSSEVSGAGALPAVGVPGAASNQPPQATTAPVSGAAAPLQAAQTGAGAASGRRDSVTNYEVDKTVRVTRDATGSVKRLNAAVVVNNRSTTDAKGKTTSQPLAREELDKLTALVRESVGFNQERGDSVKVINAPFRREVPVEVSVPLWQQPETIDLVRSLAVPGALGVVALLVVFGLVRPALKAAQAPASPRGQKLDAVVQDDLSLPDGSSPNTPVLEAPRASAQLEQARLLAQQNPAAVAGIVRGWVNGGQAA
ncbi:MAG: flagellar M-ring protein FliF [Piscinibacter sp.]|nr:flagellar M-ring protein FliF [Piscinibacter sp.]